MDNGAMVFYLAIFSPENSLHIYTVCTRCYRIGNKQHSNKKTAYPVFVLICGTFRRSGRAKDNICQQLEPVDLQFSKAVQNQKKGENNRHSRVSIQ